MAACSPFLFAAFASSGCNLLQHNDAPEAGAASATPVASAIATNTTATADTTVAPVVSATPQALAGAHRTGKNVKLPNGGTGAVVALADGGTVIVPTQADGGIAGLPNFALPTALPSGVPSSIPTTLPTALPTTLPSGFPTTLPSGFKMPTFPPPPAASH